MSTKITITATVDASPEKVWDCWNKPEHIVKWNAAIDSWHCPWAKNDLQVGGKLSSRMEAKDGSMGFDFEGTYTNIIPHQLIEYTIADGRTVKATFERSGDSTIVTEEFEAEGTNPIEMQRNGWQAILDNFKQYTEGLV